MKCLLIIGALLFHCGLLSGQATLEVDQTEIRIGDQIRATIRVTLQPQQQWVNQEAIWPDSMAGIELASPSGTALTDQGIQSVTWMLSIFDTGWVRIPALPVIISDPQRTDTLYTRDVPIQVHAVEPDSAGLRAIKDIYGTPFSPAYYSRYIPHALVVLALIIGVYLWLRQRKTKKRNDVPLPPPLLPHEWAYHALDELIRRQLWQQGEIKEHYTQLTAILREYLERRFGIHAMEQTSDEIIAQLRRQELSKDLLSDTEELLSIADLIKFAKANPGMDVHTAAIGRVRAFVTGTIPHVQVTEDIKPDHDAAVA